MAMLVFVGCTSLHFEGAPSVSILYVVYAFRGWGLEEWWAWFSSLTGKAGGVSTIIAARSRICTEAGGEGVFFKNLGRSWGDMNRIETWNCGWNTCTIIICNNPAISKFVHGRMLEFNRTFKKTTTSVLVFLEAPSTIIGFKLWNRHPGLLNWKVSKTVNVTYLISRCWNIKKWHYFPSQVDLEAFELHPKNEANLETRRLQCSRVHCLAGMGGSAEIYRSNLHSAASIFKPLGVEAWKEMQVSKSGNRLSFFDKKLGKTKEELGSYTKFTEKGQILQTKIQGKTSTKWSSFEEVN